MACPGKWKHGLNPAVGPSRFILSHGHVWHEPVDEPFPMKKLEAWQRCQRRPVTEMSSVWIGARVGLPDISKGSKPKKAITQVRAS